MDYKPKHPTGNIVNLNNFQFQYLYPSNIHPTWFDKFLINKKFSKRSNFDGDKSRQYAYKIVENTLNNQGRNGKECILKSICQANETPLIHNGLIGELWHIFLT